MGRLSAQTQMYIAIALIVVVAIGAIFLLILPQFQEASALDGQIQTERGNLTAAQALLARRQSAKAQSAPNEAALMSIANAIPDAPQLPSVIIELQDVANAAGIDLETLTPTDVTPSETGEYSKIPITLTLTGTWAELIDYMNRLASLDRSVRVTNSTFTYVPETETDPAYIQATVTLEVYVMAAAQTITPPAAAPANP